MSERPKFVGRTEFFKNNSTNIYPRAFHPALGQFQNGSNKMDAGVPDPTASQQVVTKLDRFRERFATWATFAALMVFFVVTIAFWGWAAWQAMASLAGLIF